MLRSYRTKAAVLEEDVVVDKVLDLVVDALGVDGGTHGGGIAGHRYVAHHRHATPWNALVAQVDKSLTANQTVRLKKKFFSQWPSSHSVAELNADEKCNQLGRGSTYQTNFALHQLTFFISRIIDKVSMCHILKFLDSYILRRY